MHWLALHCPTLALDCILRRWPIGMEPALAVTDLDGSRRFIALATRTAQAEGIFPGQAVPTALALKPDLVLVPRNAEDERRALTEAALAALQFTPTVSLRPTGFVMEIAASFRLFGGRRVLKKRIVQAMRTQGLAVATAEAPTPHGAWLLAQESARQRSGGERVRPDVTTALGALPIALLDHAQPYLHRFEGIGLKTVGDLRGLPTQGLARRFGPPLVDEIARAWGERPDPQTLFEAPTRFEARIELMARVEEAEALVFAAQRLLAQMSGWLAARRAAVRSFTLVLHHDRWTRDAIEPTAIPILLATPSSEHARLTTLIREKLGRFELKAPVLELSIVAPTIVEACEANATLFAEREQAKETLARLIEKLSARLGPEAMMRIVRVADHRPERAWRESRDDVLTMSDGRDARPRSRPARSTTADKAAVITSPAGTSDTPEPAADARGLPGLLGPRPAWLLVEPQALEMRGDKPLFDALPLAMMAGPERIETGWWDDAPATRDYFIAENQAGRLVWIYRERLPVQGQASWHLQGLFG